MRMRNAICGQRNGRRPRRCPTWYVCVCVCVVVCGCVCACARSLLDALDIFCYDAMRFAAPYLPFVPIAPFFIF